MTLQIQPLLKEEIENKRSFPANYETQCYHCGGYIDEGESFYFFGNKKKTCETCFQEILEYLST